MISLGWKEYLLFTITRTRTRNFIVERIDTYPTRVTLFFVVKERKCRGSMKSLNRVETAIQHGSTMILTGKTQLVRIVCDPVIARVNGAEQTHDFPRALFRPNVFPDNHFLELQSLKSARFSIEGSSSVYPRNRSFQNFTCQHWHRIPLTSHFLSKVANSMFIQARILFRTHERSRSSQSDTHTLAILRKNYQKEWYL